MQPTLFIKPGNIAESNCLYETASGFASWIIHIIKETKPPYYRAANQYVNWLILHFSEAETQDSFGTFRDLF